MPPPVSRAATSRRPSRSTARRSRPDPVPCSSGTAPPRPGGPGVAASAVPPHRLPPHRLPVQRLPPQGPASTTHRRGTGGPGHLADRAAPGPRPRHRPVAAHPCFAGRDPAPPRRGGGDRPGVGGLPRCAHPPLRTWAPTPTPARRARRRHGAADRCHGRPAHPVARRAPDHRRPDDHQPSRDPGRDHLGRRRRDRASGGQGSDPGDAPRRAASACWR